MTQTTLDSPTDAWLERSRAALDKAQPGARADPLVLDPRAQPRERDSVSRRLLAGSRQQREAQRDLERGR